MDLTRSIISHIHRAKLEDPTARVSDFQFRVVRDCPILVDLRTGGVQLLPDAHSAKRPTRSGGAKRERNRQVLAAFELGGDVDSLGPKHSLKPVRLWPS